MAPPPELIEDVIHEILLRLPPDDPASLVRASLVCKLWRRILSDSTFPDRYRELHRTPPLLGFLCGSYTDGYDESGRRFIVPVTATARIPFRQPVFGCRALDCRHGRVLLELDEVEEGTEPRRLAVWDPVTGEHKVLDRHPDPYPSGYSGAVLICAGAAASPFQVVFVRISYSFDNGTDLARAWVYSSSSSSETTAAAAAAWSAPPASVQIQYDGSVPAVWRKRAAIVGDQVYFLLCLGAGILRYDLGTRCLTLVASPCAHTYAQPGIIMARENGSLGFLGVKDDCSSLHLWAMTTSEVNNRDGSSSMGSCWVQERVISLNDLIRPVIRTAVNAYGRVLNVVGFAEGVDVLLLVVEDVRWFVFELKSGRFRELINKPEYHYYDVFFPYLSFCIPSFASHK